MTLLIISQIFFPLNIISKTFPQQKQIFVKRIFNELSLKSFKDQISLCLCSLTHSIKRYYKLNSKRTWQILSEITGNWKLKSCSLPKALNINGKIVDDLKEIASELNKFFVSVGPSLFKKIPDMLNPIDSFVFPVITYLNTLKYHLLILKMLKLNKVIGSDDINGNIAINSYNNIKDILFNILNVQ